MGLIIGGGIIVFLCLLMIVLLIKFGYESITEYVLLFFCAIIDIIHNFILKIKPGNKLKNDNIELSISEKLDKLNIKDVESVLKFYKLDDKIKSTTSYYDIKDIEKYLRKKKIQKLK